MGNEEPTYLSWMEQCTSPQERSNNMFIDIKQQFSNFW